MKKFFNSALRWQGNLFANTSSIVVTILAIFVFTSCQKGTIQVDSAIDEVPNPKAVTLSDANVLHDYTGIPTLTMWELQQARAATSKYRNIKNAFKDGYADISVEVENMGHHFMKSSINDATFDIRNPEILVYDKHEDGTYELVAVEYAIPLSASVNAPAGFTGSMDVWDANQTFKLCLLHAWVWEYNPAGVFNPTNPNVHLHE